MPYFKPTINFNMLQYVSNNVSIVIKPLEALPASLLVDFNSFIIMELSKHAMHAIS